MSQGQWTTPNTGFLDKLRAMADARLLFHVSPREFKPGELVEPGYPRPDGSPSTHVYLAGTRERAKYWALARSNVGEPARIYTYRVEPTGETEPDPEDPGTGQDFRTSSPVRVVRKMPGSVGPRQAASYSMQHTAPNPAAGHLPLHHYQGGSPDEPVRIYRSAPPGTESINPGDWISLSAEYAHQHGRHATDPGRDWPVFTAEVPQKHVHWDENEENEHGYNGPAIHRPDVHDEDSGELHDWDGWHDAHPHGQEAWAGASAHLSPAEHDFVHDEFESEDDRANTLLDAARAQGSLRSAHWRDDLYPAREDAEAHAAAHHADAPAGHRTTAFTVQRNDQGAVERIGIHHWEPSADPHELRRYQHIDDLPSWHYRHPAEGEIGTAREASMDKQAAGETAPEGHQIWAVPAEGRSPVAAEVYHNMTHREPADEHGSNWYHGISYHGPYHVIRHPQTRQVWLVDRHGRDAHPTGGHYGNPERDGNWGEHQAWQHQYGLESAGPEAHRFGTWDEPKLNEMDRRVPEFPHSRVDPEDEERVRRPAPRVHIPEGHSPSEEYHGSYEVVQHPETGRFHVVDNAGRHATTGNWDGFGTQLQAERSRDYIEKRQQSKERGRGLAESILDKGHEALDPGGTAESRQSEENMRTASEMMNRYHGGLGEIKFDPDEEGGAPYYEREHLLPSGKASGWYVKHYGGAQADVYHRATGDESHAKLDLPQHPEDENRVMIPRLHPDFGDEHLAGELRDWHDDEEGGEREYIEANNPRIQRWRRRHLGAAQHDVVAHFEDGGQPKEASVQRFAALANPHTGGQDWYHGSPYSFGAGEFSAHSASPLEYDQDPYDSGHWNALLGSHFAASHRMAEEFSKGEHGNDMGHGEEGPARNVLHARLELKHPKVYASEHDMDQEAYEHEWRAGNHHDNYHDPDELAEAKEYGAEDELPRTYRYAGHGDRLRAQSEADPEYAAMGHYHPYATGWLNAHPDKWNIAQRHRQRLIDAGHDSIVYGNEFEKHHGTADQHHVCAIPFHGGQVDVTQRHTGEHCIDPESAARQWPGRSQPMLPGFDKEGALDVVAHFEPRTAAGPYLQQKLFHMQPDPKLHAEDSMRHNPDDPMAAVRWRQQHEEGYEQPPETWDDPVKGNRDEESGHYRHPVHGGYYCHACAGYHGEPVFHEDAETAENHETAHTDWDEEYPRIPDTVHRGLLIHGGAHLAGHPDPEHVAHAILSHVGDFGTHWTGYEGQARHYAGVGTGGEGHPSDLNVVLHARKPEREDIETDPEILAERNVYGIGYHDDEEIPLRDGAPVHVTGVSWRVHGERPMRYPDTEGWRRHDFGAPAEHTAVLASAEPPVPSFTWKYQTYGPEGGYVDKEQTVTGPFYHGGRSKRLRPGSELRKGMRTNPWGDEGPRSQFIHFTTDLEGARTYARDAGGHVYEVEPTGEVKSGYIGAEWKSEHPLRVIRRVPDDDLPPATAAVVAHFEEGSPVADSLMQRLVREHRVRQGLPPEPTDEERAGWRADAEARRQREQQSAAAREGERRQRRQDYLRSNGFANEDEHEQFMMKMDRDHSDIADHYRRNNREEHDEGGEWHGDDPTLREHLVTDHMIPNPDTRAGDGTHALARLHWDHHVRNQENAHPYGLSAHWRPVPHSRTPEEQELMDALGGDGGHGDSLDAFRYHSVQPYVAPPEDYEQAARHLTEHHGLTADDHMPRSLPGIRNVHRGLHLPGPAGPASHQHDDPSEHHDPVFGSRQGTRNHWDMTEAGMRLHLKDEHGIAEPGEDPASVHWDQHSGDTQRHVHPDLEREFVMDMNPSAPRGDAFISAPGSDVEYDPVFGSRERTARMTASANPAAIEITAHFGAPGHFEFYHGEGSEDGRPRTTELEEHLYGHGGDLGHHHRLGEDVGHAWDEAYNTDPRSQRAARYHQALEGIHQREHDRMLADAHEAVQHGANPGHPAAVQAQLESEHHQQWHDEQDARTEHQRQVAEHLEDGEAHMHGRDVPFSEMIHHLQSVHGIPSDALPEHQLPTSSYHDPYRTALEETHEQHHADNSLPENGTYRHTPPGQHVTMHWGPRTDFDAEAHLVHHHGFDIDELRHDEPDLAAVHERDHAENRSHLDHHLYTVMDPEGHLPHHQNYQGPDADELREGDPEHHFEVRSRDEEGNEHAGIYHAEDEDHAREMHEDAHPYDEDAHHVGRAPVIPPRRQYTMPAAEHGAWAPTHGPLQAPGDEPDYGDTAHSWTPSAYHAPPRSREELWAHLKEHHGVTQSADSTKEPGQAFMQELHSKMHYGEYADNPQVQARATPHQHDYPEGHDPVFGSKQSRELVAHFGERGPAALDPSARDTVLAPPAGIFAPVLEALAAFGAWEPQSTAEAVTVLRELDEPLEALREGLRHALLMLEDTPLHPDAADALHEVLRCAAALEADFPRIARMLPPEASWEEPGHPNH